MYPFKAMQNVGKSLIVFLSKIGATAKQIVLILLEIFTGPFYTKAFLKQIITVGFNSLPVVGITAIFTGAALALQIFS